MLRADTYQQKKWRGGGGGTANYIKVRWEVLVNPEIDNFIPTTELQKRLPIGHKWQPQASGTVIPDDIVDELWIWWRKVTGKELKG